MENEIQIESIEKKKKGYTVKTNEDRYIFDEDTIIAHQIYKNKVFSKQEFELILQDLAVNKNLNRVLQYLRFGMRSTHEVKTYLKEELYPEKVIAKLQQLGYLNDEQLARFKVDYYQRQNKGPHYIRQKLNQIQISKDVIEKALFDYNQTVQLSLIEEQVAKAIIQNKTLPIVKQKQKIFQKLLRDGFDSADITQIINKASFADESLDQLEKEMNRLILKYQNRFSLEEVKQKVFAQLMNKGYSYSLIKDKWEQVSNP